MTDFGILILRILAGGTMLLSHGMAKLTGFSQYALRFPDIIGLGSKFSLGLAVFAEVFCAALVMVGLLTRAACVPLAATMFVAFFVVHSMDPFAKKELALIYLGMYVVIFLVGPGRLSLDASIKAKKAANTFRP